MKSKMSGCNRSRITQEQRRLMLEFMKQNPAIVAGRFEGPDGTKVRSKLLNEMANILNNQGSGATKTSEKWLRSWQDWKSDTKRKAAEIAKQTQGTGEGVTITGLSDLERQLIELIGVTSCTNVISVKAPDHSIPGPSKLEVFHIKTEESEKTRQLIDTTTGTEASTQNIIPSAIENTQRKRKKRMLSNGSINNRLVLAIERQADTNAEVARQIGKLADVGLMFLKTWAILNNVDIEEMSKPFTDK